MPLEYELTKQDDINAVAFELDPEKNRARTFLMLLTTVLLVSALLKLIMIKSSSDVLDALPQLFLTLFSALLILPFRRKSIARRTVNRRIRGGETDRQQYGHYCLLLEEEGYRLRYSGTEALHHYADVQRVTEYPQGFLIYQGQKNADIVPASAFASAAEKIDFLNLLQTQVVQAKDVGISSQSAKEMRNDAEFSLEYTWAKDSFIYAMRRANRLIFTTRLGWPAWRITIVAICFLPLVFTLYASILAAMLADIPFISASSNFDLREGIIMPLVLTCFALSPLLMSIILPWTKARYRKWIENGAIPRDYFQPQELLLRRDQITELRRTAAIDVMYDKLAYVKQDAQGMYLLLKNRRVFVIPKQAFSSPEHKRAVTAFLEAKIAEYSGRQQ